MKYLYLLQCLMIKSTKFLNSITSQLSISTFSDVSVIIFVFYFHNRPYCLNCLDIKKHKSCCALHTRIHRFIWKMIIRSNCFSNHINFIFTSISIGFVAPKSTENLLLIHVLYNHKLQMMC